MLIIVLYKNESNTVNMDMLKAWERYKIYTQTVNSGYFWGGDCKNDKGLL